MSPLAVIEGTVGPRGELSHRGVKPGSMRLRVLLVLIGLVAGETYATDSPSVSQSATSPSRYVLTPPPGFDVIENGGIRVLCEAGDSQWVRSALAGVAPVTRPTTQPADLMARLGDRRGEVIEQLSGDYAIGDVEALNRFLDERLVPELRRLEAFRPPLFYLASTREKLKSLLKDGQWQCPSFYYNRVADDVVFRQTVSLSVERPMDDTVLAVLHEAEDSAERRGERLKGIISQAQEEATRMVSSRAMFMTQMAFVDLLVEHVFRPLNLPREQQWLAIGCAGVSSADYASSIIESPRRELYLLMVAELRVSPIGVRSIDLLHPAEPQTLRAQYVAAYSDAYRRKSMMVVHEIFEQAHEKLPAMIRSLREKPCESGEELIKRIREIMGIDVSGLVAAG